MARPKSKMTDKWEVVLRFIRAYQKLYGVSPSYAVMAKGLGMKSRSNMHRMVRRLEEEGLVETKPRKYHSIKVVDKSVMEIASL